MRKKLWYFPGPDPPETAEDDDGPDGVSVQVCPHRSHQLSGTVETHLGDIPTSDTLGVKVMDS